MDERKVASWGKSWADCLVDVTEYLMAALMAEHWVAETVVSTDVSWADVLVGAMVAP